MTTFELEREGMSITTARERIDVGAVLRLLNATHWACDMTRELLERAIAGSLCFSLFDGARQIGFARLVTDSCTYGYLTDVVVDADYRGRGLGKWLMEAVVSHPDLRGLRRIALLTRDAQSLYTQFGFTEDTGRLTYMERRASG